MKTLLKSLKLTLIFCLFFALFYVLVLWLFARVVGPNKGDAELVSLNGKVVGAANVAQNFTQPIYFFSRPSAADYSADASSGSNYGPSNEEYLGLLKSRRDTFLLQHPYLAVKDVPSEMITQSSSGLDPDISKEAAYIQIKRVAMARNMSEADVKKIVDANITKSYFGLIGPAKVNVLKLNVSLDQK